MTDNHPFDSIESAHEYVRLRRVLLGDADPGAAKAPDT